jgi:hypothetical protein
MWSITYQFERDGDLHTCEERWSSLSKFKDHAERTNNLSAFQSASQKLNQETSNFRIIAVKDPMGRIHNRRTAMKRGF